MDPCFARQIRLEFADESPSPPWNSHQSIVHTIVYTCGLSTFGVFTLRDYPLPRVTASPAKPDHHERFTCGSAPVAGAES